MIVRAAVVVKCRRIYTEHFHGQDQIDRVEIVNPLRRREDSRPKLRGLRLGK